MKKVLLFLLLAIALFLVYVATRPDTYHVERSTTIAAASEPVYEKVVHFRQWGGWSPWEKLDPAMKREFGGVDGEVGSTYSWVGNSDVGEGRMTLTDAKPASRVAVRLDFIKPFESTGTSIVTLSPEGAGTKVTWAMDGDHNFISKAMCVFMSMDKMVGGDLEKGLGSLKSAVESAPVAPAAAP